MIYIIIYSTYINYIFKKKKRFSFLLYKKRKFVLLKQRDKGTNKKKIKKEVAHIECTKAESCVT